MDLEVIQIFNSDPRCWPLNLMKSPRYERFIILFRSIHTGQGHIRVGGGFGFETLQVSARGRHDFRALYGCSEVIERV